MPGIDRQDSEANTPHRCPDPHCHQNHFCARCGWELKTGTGVPTADGKFLHPRCVKKKPRKRTTGAQ